MSSARVRDGIGAILLLFGEAGGFGGKLVGGRSARKFVLRLLDIVLDVALLLPGLRERRRGLALLRILRLFHGVGGGGNLLVGQVLQGLFRIVAAVQFGLGGEVVVFQLRAQGLDAPRQGFRLFADRALRFLRLRHRGLVLLLPRCLQLFLRLDLIVAQIGQCMRLFVQRLFQTLLHLDDADDVDADRSWSGRCAARRRCSCRWRPLRSGSSPPLSAGRCRYASAH